MTQDSDEKDTEYERIHALVAEKAQAWDQADQPDELLLRGEELEQIEPWWRWVNSSANRFLKVTSLESQYVQCGLFERSTQDLPRTLEPYLTDEQYDIRKPVAAMSSHLEMMHETFESQPQRLPSLCENITDSAAELFRLAMGLDLVARDLSGKGSGHHQDLARSIHFWVLDYEVLKSYIRSFAEVITDMVSKRQLEDLPKFLDHLDKIMDRVKTSVDHLWQAMTDDSSDNL